MNCIESMNVHQVTNLVVATADTGKLARWKEGLEGYAFLSHIDNLDRLKEELLMLNPELLLLDHDLPGFDGVSGIHELRKLSPGTKIVMLRGSASEEEEWTMFKAGIRGCCEDDMQPSSIITLVEAIQKGELWIRRALTHRLLAEMQEKQKRSTAAESSLSLLKNLTHREYEIAVRVGNGDSNKEIANSLDITERTVKSHLTTIFRKLNVTDRLKVALILTEDERQAWRSPH